MTHTDHPAYFRIRHKELRCETTFKEWMLTAQKGNIFLFAVYQSLSLKKKVGADGTEAS